MTRLLVFVCAAALAALVPVAQPATLHFELAPGSGQGNERCVEQFLPKESLVNGVVDVPTKPFQRLDVTITDDSAPPNKHWSQPNANGNYKLSFTTHVDSNIRMCFINTLENGQTPSPDLRRAIMFRLDHGSEIHNYSFDLEKQKLQPHEIELLRLEGVITDILNDIMYLDKSNDEMHGVNEATLRRVANFSFLSIGVLIVLGGWQVWYLHGFFKAKKLI